MIARWTPTPMYHNDLWPYGTSAAFRAELRNAAEGSTRHIDAYTRLHDNPAYKHIDKIVLMMRLYAEEAYDKYVIEHPEQQTNGGAKNV